VLDQHKAAERVIYERLQRAEEQRGNPSQLLMIPVTLELTHREAAALEENLAALGALGFALESFGQNTYLLRAIPLALVDRNYEVAARELIGELAEGRAPEGLQAQRERVIAMVACKSALKAGEAMSPAEMAQLLTDLQATDRPDRCPHGSPIAVAISLTAVHAKFGRQ
jgi:DNA mismatch repair protein MutL